MSKETTKLKFDTKQDTWHKVDDDSLYTGEIVEYFGSGKEESKTRFSGGKIDGASMVWFENGEKKTEINYCEGKRDGVSTWWNEDGTVRTKVLYSEGRVTLANSWDDERNRKDPLVEFYFDGRPANNVLIVGEFTDWEENPIRMDRISGNLWSKRVILPEGVYKYRYIIDGAWEDDPFCKIKEEENCVVEFSVIEDGVPELKKNETEKPSKNPEQLEDSDWMKRAKETQREFSMKRKTSKTNSAPNPLTL